MNTKLRVALLVAAGLWLLPAAASFAVDPVPGPNFMQVGRAYHIVTVAGESLGVFNGDVTVIGSGGGGWYRVEYQAVATLRLANGGQTQQITKEQAWLNFAHVVLAREIVPGVTTKH